LTLIGLLVVVSGETDLCFSSNRTSKAVYLLIQGWIGSNDVAHLMRPEKGDPLPV